MFFYPYHYAKVQYYVICNGFFFCSAPIRLVLLHLLFPNEFSSFTSLLNFRTRFITHSTKKWSIQSFNNFQISFFLTSMLNLNSNDKVKVKKKTNTKLMMEKKVVEQLSFVYNVSNINYTTDCICWIGFGFVKWIATKHKTESISDNIKCNYWLLIS